MKTGSEFKVVVKYDNFQEAIKAGAYDRNWTYNLLDHTPIYQSDNIYCQLFNYYNDVSHIDIELDMALNFYRPATALEALAFGAQYPEMQKKFKIISLGTKTKGDYQQVLELNSGAKGRTIGLETYNSSISWQPRYLGIRNNTDSPAPIIDTEKGDWLPLLEDLKFLQKRISDKGFHLIDTDHYPFIPEGTFNPNILLKHEKMGLIECKPGAISIIKPGANCSTHEEFINELHKKKIQTANSNILDYWLKYPEAIPEECKTGRTAFYGTILKDDNDTQFIRSMNADFRLDITCQEESLQNIIHADVKAVILNV